MKKNLKKNGFIAISMIYSVFILFVTILIAIMFSYITDRKTSNAIKQDIKNRFASKLPERASPAYRLNTSLPVSESHRANETPTLNSVKAAKNGDGGAMRSSQSCFPISVKSRSSSGINSLDANLSQA